MNVNRSPERQGLIVGLYTEGPSPAGKDYFPPMLSRTQTGFKESSGRFLHVFPSEGRVLFVPARRLTPELLEEARVDAAIGIPRGYAKPFVLEHRVTDVADFTVIRAVRGMRERVTEDLEMHSLHKIDADGTEQFFAAGFLNADYTGIEIGRRGDRGLFLLARYTNIDNRLEE